MRDKPDILVLCDVDGVLTDGRVDVSDDGTETLRFHKRDGWLIRDAAEHGIEVVLITDDPTPGCAAHRASKLGLPLRLGGKPEAVRHYRALGYRVAFIGDSAADLEAMREADEAWRPIDAMIEEGQCTSRRGGDGVLHEVLSVLIARASAHQEQP